MQGSRRDIGLVMKQQMKGFARYMVDLTPPNRGGTRGVAAKKSGEKAIEGDIRNSFEAVHPNRAEISMAEMPGIVKGLRQGGRKRIRTKVANARKASRGDITKFVRIRKKRVGHLAGAWIKAGLKFGKIAAPAWIKRHLPTTKGFGRFKRGTNKIVAEIVNAVKFASDINGLERRAQYALNAQARKMNRQVDHRLERIAKRSGFNR